MKKMKKNFFVTTLVTIAAFAVSVSCTHRDDLDIPSKQRTAVQFSSNIVTHNINLKAAGSTWNASDKIGIYMYEENDINVVEEMENIPYTTNSGGTTGNFEPKNTVIYFPDNGDKVRFMAYYPYQDDISSTDNLFKVDVSDQSVQENIDLLYSFATNSKYDKKSPGKKVALSFTHQLTKVYIYVKAGDGLANTDLQALTTSFLGFQTKADFNLTDGTLGNPDTQNTIILNPIETVAGYAVCFEAIVLPTPSTPLAQIEFNLNNGDEGTGIDNDLFSWNFDHKLDPSTKYTYSVTINRSGIVVEATINDWIINQEQEIIAE